LISKGGCREVVVEPFSSFLCHGGRVRRVFFFICLELAEHIVLSHRLSEARETGSGLEVDKGEVKGTDDDRRGALSFFEKPANVLRVVPGRGGEEERE
jgi:hypothetical protein